MTWPSITAPNRRSVLIRAGVTVAAAVAPKILVAAELVATPGQTEGPFYPVEFPADMDNDLVRVTGQATRALGQVVHVSGRVLDLRGRPKPGSVVEIWQCDANGIYRHPVRRGRAVSTMPSRATAARRSMTKGGIASAPSGRCRIPGARRTFILPCMCRGRDGWSRTKSSPCSRSNLRRRAHFRDSSISS